MARFVTVVAAALVTATVAFGAAAPTIGTKLSGRVATLTGSHFPVKGCPKGVKLAWKTGSTSPSHSLGTAKLGPKGTYTFVWHIPASIHGALYVTVDDNCVVKGQQQAYSTYYSFTAP